MNSLPHKTHEKLYELLSQSMEKCFCDHFGLGGYPCNCNGLTRTLFEDYVDAKDIKKLEMKQTIIVDKRVRKDERTQHQYVFFDTVFDFFNNFEVIVSTFNWRSWMYNEINRRDEHLKKMKAVISYLWKNNSR